MNCSLDSVRTVILSFLSIVAMEGQTLSLDNVQSIATRSLILIAVTLGKELLP